MTISSLATTEPALAPNRARVWNILRWVLLIPCYLITLVTAFCAIWVSVLEVCIWLPVLDGPWLNDKGASESSVAEVSFAAFTAIVLVVWIAPRYKRAVAVFFSILTVCLLPYPYTSPSTDPGDWDVIPSAYKFVGAVLGSLLAIALVFFWSKRAQSNPSP